MPEVTALFEIAALAVQPCPGRLVAAQAEYALKTECAGTVLLACNEPHRLKPNLQRLAGALKHGSRSN